MRVNGRVTLCRSHVVHISKIALHLVAPILHRQVVLLSACHACKLYNQFTVTQQKRCLDATSRSSSRGAMVDNIAVVDQGASPSPSNAENDTSRPRVVNSNIYNIELTARFREAVSSMQFICLLITLSDQLR